MIDSLIFISVLQQKEAYLNCYDFLFIEKLKAQATELEKIIAIKDQRLTHFLDYDRQLKATDTKLAELSTKLVKAAMVPLLLETLLLEGGKSGVQIKAFERLANSNGIPCTQVPVKMSLVGTYHNLATFISRLVALEAMIMLENFSIESKDHEGLLAMEILAIIYHSAELEVHSLPSAKQAFLVPLTVFPILKNYQPQFYTLASHCTPFQAEAIKIVGTVVFRQQQWNLILRPDGVVDPIKFIVNKGACK